MFSPQHGWFPLVAPAVEVVTKAAHTSETPSRPETLPTAKSPQKGVPMGSRKADRPWLE